VKGPVVVVLVGLVGGWLLDGPGGALAGLVTTLGLIGGSIAAMVLWAERIGRLLPADQARRLAPCPPGFSRLCEVVYHRVLPEPPPPGL
jgi:hypothetical protein